MSLPRSKGHNTRQANHAHKLYRKRNAAYAHFLIREDPKCAEIGYVGLALEPIRVAAVMNHSSAESEIATSIHELGHLYGVIDHYGGFNGLNTTQDMQDRYSDRGYSSRCIYGEDKYDSSVMEDLIICDGCKSWIIENRSRFSG